MPPIYFHGNYNKYKEQNNGLVGSANSLLQKAIFQHGHHYYLCIFARDEQEPACHTSKTSISRGDTLFHYFTVLAVPLLGKCCPCSLSFIGLNRWNPKGIKSRLFSGYGRTVQPRLGMSSTIFKLSWGLVLPSCKRKAVFSSGLTLEAFS